MLAVICGVGGQVQMVPAVLFALVLVAPLGCASGVCEHVLETEPRQVQVEEREWVSPPSQHLLSTALSENQRFLICHLLLGVGAVGCPSNALASNVWPNIKRKSGCGVRIQVMLGLG